MYRALLAARRKLYGDGSTQLNTTLDGLARVREKMGDTTSAEPFVRELVTITTAARPATDSTLLARKVWLGTTLCASGKAAEGGRLIREVLTTIAPRDTSGVRVARQAVDACDARAPKLR